MSNYGTATDYGQLTIPKDVEWIKTWMNQKSFLNFLYS